MSRLFAIPAKSAPAGHLFVIGFLATWFLYRSLVELVCRAVGCGLTSRPNVCRIHGRLHVYSSRILPPRSLSLFSSVVWPFLHYLEFRFWCMAVEPLFKFFFWHWLVPRHNLVRHLGCYRGVCYLHGVIPFAIINMREALINLDKERIEMSVSFTRSGWRRFRLVILPSLSFIFSPSELVSALHGRWPLQQNCSVETLASAT